jgi:hypothetical protein
MNEDKMDGTYRPYYAMERWKMSENFQVKILKVRENVRDLGIDPRITLT